MLRTVKPSLRPSSATALLRSQPARGLHGAATPSQETTPSSKSSPVLTDTFGRHHTYLRLSVTERCNLRCLYCMPSEGVSLSPSPHLLTTPELTYLSTLFVTQGVRKIRLTGGEPLVRKDFISLMHQLGSLRDLGLRELCVTTNGVSMNARKLDEMLAAGLTGVNLSLDTLDTWRYQIMTRRNGFEKVMRNIERMVELVKSGAGDAVANGLKIKINCVVIRGLNDKEIIPFVEMTRSMPLEIRFIEYMPFDGNKWDRAKMFPYTEMLSYIRDKYPNLARCKDHPNDTSKAYQVPGFLGKVGFITSMTHNFCGTCNRLRITADGSLKVCLFGNKEVSLRDYIREANDGRPIDDDAMSRLGLLDEARRTGNFMETRALRSGELVAPHMAERDKRLLDIIGIAVRGKKARHAGMDELKDMKNRPMILIDKSKPYHYTTLRTIPASYSPMDSYSASVPKPRKAGWAISPYLPFRGRLSHERGDQFRLFSSERNRTPRKATSEGPSKSESPAINKLHRFYESPRKESLWDIDASDEDAFDISIAQGQKKKKNASSKDTTATQTSSSSRNQRGGTPLTSEEAQPSKTNNDHLDQISHAHLPHLTPAGDVHMTSIASKPVTSRVATATARVSFSNLTPYTLLTSNDGYVQKGDVISVARIGAIMAAKKAADLIPLAHPGLGITGIEVHIDVEKPSGQQDETATRSTKKRVKLRSSRAQSSQGGEPAAPVGSAPAASRDRTHYGSVLITTTVHCLGRTGVEMEALTGALGAALTVYDMCKATDRGMVVGDAFLVKKSGGRSGDWHKAETHT